MLRLCAQGDILVERVADAPVSGRTLRVADAAGAAGAVVVAEGELSGHRHTLFGCVTLYRDDGLARDIPDNLYIGHVQVTGPAARLEHDEHTAIELPPGTYRLRRQRHLEPSDVGLLGD
jgi:hypothetical protein